MEKSHFMVNLILDPYGMTSDAVGVWSGLLTFFFNLDYHMYCADLNDIFFNLPLRTHKN